MAKRKLLLLGVLLSLAGSAFSAPQTAAAPSGIKAYEEQEFIADSLSSKSAIPHRRSIKRPNTPSNSISCVTCRHRMQGPLDLHGRKLRPDWRCRWQNLQSL